MKRLLPLLVLAVALTFGSVASAQSGQSNCGTGAVPAGVLRLHLNTGGCLEFNVHAQQGSVLYLSNLYASGIGSFGTIYVLWIEQNLTYGTYFWNLPNQCVNPPPPFCTYTCTCAWVVANGYQPNFNIQLASHYAVMWPESLYAYSP